MDHVCWAPLFGLNKLALKCLTENAQFPFLAEGAGTIPREGTTAQGRGTRLSADAFVFQASGQELNRGEPDAHGRSGSERREDGPAWLVPDSSIQSVP